MAISFFLAQSAICRPRDRKDDADAAPQPQAAPRPARHQVQQERGVQRGLLPARAAALPAGEAVPLAEAQRHHALLRARRRRHLRRGTHFPSES